MVDLASDQAPPVGTRLGGGYELLRFLGAGGMGAVYEAKSPDGQRVAVKVLLGSSLGPEVVERFKREAAVTGTIQSPHVVRLIEAGIDRVLQIPYMVMPLLVGLDLQELIDRRGPIHPTTAVRIIRQACAALESAHALGVVHRDIKPANIYLDHDRHGAVTVRVLDFGVAKWAAQDGAALTRTGMVFGTPLFMSPEQIMSSKDVDVRTDVWSLGMTLYYLLCGTVPLANEESVAELYVALTMSDVPPLQDLAAWITPGLAMIAHGTLVRDRAQRCPSARELASALAPYSFGSDELSAAMLEPLSDELTRFKASRAEPVSSWQGMLEDLPEPTTAVLAFSPEPIDPLLGENLLGRYTILRRIGKGGMGAVYEACDGDGNRVAVKVIDRELAGRNEALRRRFVREVRAVTSLHSPHVVKVLEADAGPDQAMPFIVMELLRGLDLGVLIERHGPLPPLPVARLFVQACRGLGAAHAQKLIHRDIKPANLFLHVEPTGQVVVKICDFGIAKQLDADGNDSQSSQLTRTGGMMGSPMFMSPEQAKNARHVDLRTDLWSLGASLFHALAGRPLWHGHQAVGEIIVAICTEPVPRIQDVAPWVPPALALCIDKALRRDPKERYPSVERFERALWAFVGGDVAVTPAELHALPAMTRAEIAPRAALDVQDAGTAAAPERSPAPAMHGVDARDARAAVTTPRSPGGGRLPALDASQLTVPGLATSPQIVPRSRTRRAATLVTLAAAVLGVGSVAYWRATAATGHAAPLGSDPPAAGPSGASPGADATGARSAATGSAPAPPSAGPQEAATAAEHPDAGAPTAAALASGHAPRSSAAPATPGATTATSAGATAAKPPPTAKPRDTW